MSAERACAWMGRPVWTAAGASLVLHAALLQGLPALRRPAPVPDATPRLQLSLRPVVLPAPAPVASRTQTSRPVAKHEVHPAEAAAGPVAPAPMPEPSPVEPDATASPMPVVAGLPQAFALWPLRAEVSAAAQAAQRGRQARAFGRLMLAVEGLQRAAPEGPDIQCSAMPQLACSPRSESDELAILQLMQGHPEGMATLASYVLARREGRWRIERAS